MAISKIKGITIEIGGNTTKLGKSLEGINKQSKDLQREIVLTNNKLENPSKETKEFSSVLQVRLKVARDNLKEIGQNFKLYLRHGKMERHLLKMSFLIYFSSIYSNAAFFMI